MTFDFPVHNQRTSLFGDHSEGHRVRQTAHVVVKGETQEEDMAEVLPPLLGHVLCDLKTSLQLTAKSTKLDSKSLNKKPCRAIPGLGEAPAVVRLSSGSKGGGIYVQNYL